MGNGRSKIWECIPGKVAPGRVGWAALFFLVMLVAAPAWAEERLAVHVSLAKVRSGPGDDYPWIWKVERYHPVLVLETSGAWHRISDFEGDQGWIKQTQASKIPAVITVRPVCNIRPGPGTKNAPLFTVGKGIPFKQIGKKGNWLQVAHADGDRGWIHKSLVW